MNKHKPATTGATQVARQWLGALAVLALGNCSAPDKPRPAPLAGHYEGRLTFQGAATAAVLDVRPAAAGKYQADLALPDMGGLGFAANRLRYQPPRLRFERAPGNGRMVVDATQQDNELRGTFAADGLTAGLVLVRRGAPKARPYREVPLTIRSGPLQLAGTLLVPVAPGLRRPAVVLLHGSGDPHQGSLLAYATLLAKNGFVALVFDRRDAQLPDTQEREYDQLDLAADAMAAVRALKSRPEVDAARVGLWGISQGAHVAALVAGAANQPVAFVVAVSSPGVPYAAVGRFQLAERLRRHGFASADIHDMNRALDVVEGFVRAGGTDDTTSVDRVLRETRQRPWARYVPWPRHVPTVTEIRRQLRWRQLDLDPRAAWERVRVPALLLYGSADDRFDAPQSAQRLRQVVMGRPGTAVHIYPNADHELMLPAGVRPDTHGQWAWPLPAPGYLSDMLTWMRQQANR